MEIINKDNKQYSVQTIRFMIDFANSVKNKPHILEMKQRIETGDIEQNIAKELDRLRDLKKEFPQHSRINELIWLLVNYLFGNLKRLQTILEIDINTKQKGVLFVNIVKSHERVISFMLDKGLIDSEKFKEEIEIFKLGFPDDKVTKFSERALNSHLSKTTLPTKPLHFTRLFTQEQLKQLFSGLTTGGFLSKDTTGADFKAFCYILGVGKPADFKYLNWIGFIKDLNAFINTFYNGERAKWKKTVSCFKWDNNLINQNSLKTANDAYDEDPPSIDYFKKLKKNIQ